MTMRRVLPSLLFVGALSSPLSLAADPGEPRPPGYDDRCPEGSVNVVAPNYAEGAGVSHDCEFLLTVERIDRRLDNLPGFSFVEEIQGIRTIAHAHSLMWRIGQCGFIAYGPGGWESPGRFYPGSELRVTAIRLPPCVLEADRPARRPERP